MKLIKSLIMLFFLISLGNVSATTHTISVGGFSFTPASLTANVGDTIKWVWASGIHTTSSITVPTSAAPWSNPIDSAHMTFTYIISVPGTYSYRCNYHYLYGMLGAINVGVTSIKPVSNEVPDKFNLYQNYPNPFNPTTTINFDISKNAVVKLTIFDITGRDVATLVKQELQPGRYSVEWNAANFSSGLYFYKLEVPGYSITKKLMIIK